MTAELVRRIADAADFGHCLECGADIPFSNAIAGAVLCKPCDAEAAEHQAEIDALAAVVLPRIMHELATTRRIGELDAPQGELAL